MKAYLELQEIALMESVATYCRDKLLVRLLGHLGCRISEVLALEVKDIDFAQGTVTIQHLKTRSSLACPGCGARLGRHHSFCPGCGNKVRDVTTTEREHRRVRTLPLDKNSLDMLLDYVKRGGPIERDHKILLFPINRHRAWGIVKELAETSRAMSSSYTSGELIL